MEKIGRGLFVKQTLPIHHGRFISDVTIRRSRTAARVSLAGLRWARTRSTRIGFLFPAVRRFSFSGRIANTVEATGIDDAEIPSTEVHGGAVGKVVTRFMISSVTSSVGCSMLISWKKNSSLED